MHDGRMYYWILATYQGKTLLIGPKESEEDAYQMGFEKLDCTFDVIPLPTRDKNRASGMVKARRLNQGVNIEQALENVRHKTDGNISISQKRYSPGQDFSARPEA